MHKEVTREEMRELDRIAIERYGIPGLILMENAGRCVAEVVKGLIRETDGLVAVVCGKGNNGGDGFVAARHLANSGYEAIVILLAPRSTVRGDVLVNLGIWEKMGGAVTEVLEERDITSFRNKLRSSSAVVDAIFGTGLEKEIDGIFRLVISAINDAGKPVVAVDIPSGLCANTGTLMGAAVRADVTVTFGLPKVGFSKADGPSYAGEVRVADISLPRQLLEI